MSYNYDKIIRPQSPWQKLDGIEKAPLVVVLMMLLLVTLTALNAWMIMLIWGAIGASVLDAKGDLRTISYNQAFPITIAIMFVTNLFKRSSN